jgi:hypothetical protein
MTLSPVPAPLQVPTAATTKEIIDLELSQELQDLGIVTDFSFEAYNTKNFVLELNHAYNNKRVYVITIKTGIDVNDILKML